MKRLKFTRPLRILTVALLCGGILISLPAMGGIDEEKKKARRQVELTVNSLRELIRPTAKRIEYAARELARLGDVASDPLIDYSTDPEPAIRRLALVALAKSGSTRFIPVFVRALADPVPNVVIDAARALAPHHGDWPTRALVRYLGHRDPLVRQVVATALDKRPADVIQAIIRKLLISPPPAAGRGPFLAALGRYPDATALNDLVAALSDGKVGLYAVRGLGYFGNKAAPRAVQWMVKHGEKHLKTAAALAHVIGKFPEVGEASVARVLDKASIPVQRVTVHAHVRSRGEKSAEWLTAMTGHSRGGVRQAALEIIPSTPGADPVRHLKENLSHDMKGVRQLAARALMNWRRDPIAQTHVVMRYRVLARQRTEESLNERVGLLRALGRVGDQVAVAELINALGEESEANAAIRGLGDIGKRAVRSLLFVVKTDDAARSPRAVQALGFIGRPALKPMLDLLRHPNMEVRNIARRALAKMNATNAVPQIVKLIEDPKMPGRQQLILLLGRLPSTDSLNALKRLVTKANDQNLRLAAVKALARMPYKAVLPVLRYLARKDPSNDVRLWSVQSLVGRADKESVPLFKKMLASEKPFIKQACAFGLGYLGEPGDIPEIAKAMSNPRPFVLASIRNSLRRLSYAPSLRYEEQFTKWLKEHKKKRYEKFTFKPSQMSLGPMGKLTYWLGGQGKPLLILHGGPDFDHTYLKPGYDALSKDRVLMYVDLPGRGKSKLGKWASVGVRSDARAIALLLVKLNFRNIDILAHGWGAHVATQLAAIHPKLVGRLILDNPVAPTFTTWLEDVAVAEKQTPEPWATDIKMLKDPLPLFFAEVRDQFSTWGLMTSKLANPGHMVRLAPLMKTRPAIRQSMLQAMGDFDYKRYFEKIAKPTLVIQGVKNPVATNTQIWWENLKRSNGKVKFVSVQAAGILPALEQPEAFRKAVLAFLGKK